MAIKIAHETRFGDSYANAYARITSVNINYVSQYADVSICIYRSEEDRSTGKDPVSLENIRYRGIKFEEFFREISVDKIDARVNPLADVYTDLTGDAERVDNKYFGGEKLYDEKEGVDGEFKEVSKDEFLAKRVVDVVDEE
jgi:hypothetical protein